MKNWKGFERQALSLMSVFLNAFVTSCTTNWLPNVLFLVTRPDHNPSITLSQSRNIASISEIGKLLLTLPGGCLAAKFGRKKILIFVWCLNCFSWIIVSVNSSIVLIYVARFCSGAADGLSSLTAGIVTGEISSPHYRGIFSSITAVSANSGTLFVSLVSATFVSYKAVTYSATILCFCFLPSIHWLRESPYYFVSTGQYEKAKHNLTVLRAGSKTKEIENEFEALKESIDFENKSKTKTKWYELLKRKSIRKAFLGAVLMSSLTPACGWSSIRLYMTVSFPSTQYLSNSMYPLLSSSLTFVSSMISVALVERFPRKSFFMFGSFLSFIILSFSSASCYVYSYRERYTEFWKWCFIVSNFLYLVIGAITMGPLVETIRSEIFPYSVKGVGNAVCLIFRSVSVIICYKLYHVFEENFGLYTNFVFFAVNSVIVAVVVHVLLPETRGKSLVEVQRCLEGFKTGEVQQER